MIIIIHIFSYNMIVLTDVNNLLNSYIVVVTLLCLSARVQARYTGYSDMPTLQCVLVSAAKCDFGDVSK